MAPRCGKLFAAAVICSALATCVQGDRYTEKYDWKKMVPHPGENGKADCHHIGMPDQWFESMKSYIKIGTKEHLESQLKAMKELYEKSDGDKWPSQWRNNWADISKGCNWPEAGFNGQWTGLVCHSGVWNPPPPKSAGLGVQIMSLPHGLVKVLPDSLRHLICTPTIQIPKSQITGTLPDWSHQICTQLFDLSDNQIAGSIPDDFMPAPCLSAFSLANNKLEGTIPETLRSKTVLMSLKLNNNMLSGTIPEFGAMPELKELDLSGNRLSGTIPKSILAMPKLRWLRLHQNQLSGPIPEEIGLKLTRLSMLSVRGNDGMESLVPDSVAQLPLRVFNGTSSMKCSKSGMLRHVPESTSCGGRPVGPAKGSMKEADVPK
eukprot:TRINITY_DN26143_c0_g1_i1.p1 TRINITY_DN26143_c0_g1~~TRINITY_DN26143_c0_g1_i1.p1  ORF type:complete len:376 (+),score=158.38 TRINITY_DN26143_c0_g1_i1:268-1395(+)